jgi:hypothetical protein
MHLKSISVIVFLIIMKIIKTPVQIYDIAAGRYMLVELYIHSPKTQTDNWVVHTLKNQGPDACMTSSSEWFRGGQYIEKEHPGEEKDFIEGPPEWTGTALCFDSGELIEGITLDKNKTPENILKDPYNAIVSAKTRLGRQDGILLPKKSGYIRNLGEEYTPLIQQLWGIENSAELPSHAFLSVTPTGFWPVVRGACSWDHHVSGWVDVYADFDPAARRFAARLVSKTRPENTITPQEYEKLLKQISEKPILIE